MRYGIKWNELPIFESVFSSTKRACCFLSQGRRDREAAPSAPLAAAREGERNGEMLQYQGGAVLALPVLGRLLGNSANLFQVGVLFGTIPTLLAGVVCFYWAYQVGHVLQHLLLCGKRGLLTCEYRGFLAAVLVSFFAIRVSHGIYSFLRRRLTRRSCTFHRRRGTSAHR